MRTSTRRRLSIVRQLFSKANKRTKKKRKAFSLKNGGPLMLDLK